MLLFLALEPEARKDHMAEVLWPNSKNAAGSLRTAQWNLRKHLNREASSSVGGCIRATSKHLQLDPDIVSVDLWDLRAIGHSGATPIERATAFRAILADYDGDLGADIDADWIEPYRQDIRREITDRGVSLADELIDHDHTELAVELLHDNHALDPYAEPVVQKILMLEHELGRPDDAVRTYRAFADKLSEIGAQPLPLTAKLAHKRRDDQPTGQR
jgi:DNA-binding SARP family transcriptional activator